ncbi:hypothetical protein EPN96_01265 [bacterium]|nr:MAG: hypothetical protein EPN96_01265 [bacterium]
MDISRETALRRLEQTTLYLTVIAVVAGVFLLLLRALVHFPFFDESLHARQLWMISAGMKPGPDFFSAYPVLAYLFVMPFFRLFPESAFVLLALRFLSILAFAGAGALFYGHGKNVARDWAFALFPIVLLAASGNVGPFLVEFSIDHYAALTAVGAMVLFFCYPKPANIAFASFLCLLSVAITPKYALPLFFGLIGYAAAGWLGERQTKKLALAVVAGGVSAAMLVFLLYAAYGISLVENIKTAHILTSKLAMGKQGDYLAGEVFANFGRRPLLGALLLLGVAGWAKRSWGKKDSAALAGAGILLGIIIFCIRIRFPLEQYQTPVYVSLALFAPFGLTLFGEKRVAAKVARGVLAAAVLTVVLNQLPAVGREFRETNLNLRDTENTRASKVPAGVAALASLDGILGKIPRDERVIAIWVHNPLFRRDITGMPGDDRPSFTGIMDRNDPYYRFFDPATLRAELQKSPPALIDTFFLDNNYPPGWDGVVRDYLSRNIGLYQPVPSPMLRGWSFYIRKDLMNR